MKQAIAEMQDFVGLPMTGELDKQTIAKMKSPRCGVADFVGPRKNARLVKRYALSGQQWSKKAISYR